MNELQTKILALKKAQNAIVLAHYYQPLPVQDIADFVGDSFALAKLAQNAKQEKIILCGVRFMAESAKILNPEKTVFLPVSSAGCPMADMIAPEDIRALRAKYPAAAIVCYVNSSAAVKAESDVCCTSSSAEKIVRALPNKQIVFVPDKNLGSYVAEMVPEKEVILYDGCCPIHDGVSLKDAQNMKQAYPQAKLLIHPECRAEVVALADYVGSTAGILDYARKTEAEELIIGTEVGVFEILKRELPNKKILLLRENFLCENMKKTTLEDVLACLEGKIDETLLAETEMKAARKSLERMIEIG
ncbi:MAG: quinolinate synthase NadA [Oscillospiraceae bacterium]